MQLSKEDFLKGQIRLLELPPELQFSALPQCFENFTEVGYLDSLVQIMAGNLSDQQQEGLLSLLPYFQAAWELAGADAFIKQAIQGNGHYIQAHLPDVSPAAKVGAFIQSPKSNICQKLLSAGVDINSCMGYGTYDREFGITSFTLYTALWKACQEGQKDKTAWLIEQGANVRLGLYTADYTGRYRQTPAIAAIEADSADCLQMLLRTGAFQNDLPELFKEAVSEGKFRTAKLLLTTAHIPVTQEILQTAIDSRNSQLVYLLLHNGVRADQELLFYAVKESNAAVVDTLLQHLHYDVNRPDTQGRTLLFLAAQLLDKKMCVFLLKKGASTALRDKEGRTVWDYIKTAPCESGYQREFVSFLQQAARESSSLGV